MEPFLLPIEAAPPRRSAAQRHNNNHSGVLWPGGPGRFDLTPDYLDGSAPRPGRNLPSRVATNPRRVLGSTMNPPPGRRANVTRRQGTTLGTVRTEFYCPDD